jgi:large subunit ribosomal protein L25
MAQSVIEATTRKASGKGAARAARRENLVPAVVYGDNKPAVPINIKYNDLIRALKAGRFLSKLITLRVDGEDNRVICRSVQRDVVKDLPIHADFLRLSRTARIALYIPVEFENRDESPGLKRGGVLNIVRHTIELRCLAEAIPEYLEADLTGLDIGDTVHVSAIPLPEDVELTVDRDFTVATIVGQMAEEPEEEEEEEAEGEEAAEAEEGEGEDEEGAGGGEEEEE